MIARIFLKSWYNFVRLLVLFHSIIGRSIRKKLFEMSFWGGLEHWKSQISHVVKVVILGHIWAIIIRWLDHWSLWKTICWLFCQQIISVITIKRNKVKMCLKGGPKNQKMSPITKTVDCHPLTHLSYWWRVDTISSVFIFLDVKFKTFLVHKLYLRSQHSMGQGPGGLGAKNWQNLSHSYSSLNHRFFHASSSRTLTMTLLLAIRIYFGPFRGVMKIRIAVTLAVLGLSGPWQGPRIFIQTFINS